MNAPERRFHRTMCPMNCHPTLCGMKVETEGDRLVAITGDETHPDSHGFLCIRGESAHQIIGNPERLLKPLIRRQRGADDWREASWDEAMEMIADRIRAVRPDQVGIWGGHGLAVNDYGVSVKGQLLARFANLYGAQTWNGAMICWGLGGFGFGITGALDVSTKRDLGENAEMIVLWGANFTSQANSTKYVADAKARGAKIVCIDVRRTEAMAMADVKLVIRPGTDVALALAVMHVLIRDGLTDADFIAEHTVGFSDLKPHINSFTPDWAAAETGLSAEAIEDFARAYGTTRPATIVAGGSSLHKGRNSWLAARAIGCLPALVGDYGVPGGGMGPRHGVHATGRGLGDVTARDRRAAPQTIPAQMPELIRAMEDGRIKVMLTPGANMVSSFPDPDRVAAALGKTDLVVCHDLFMSETARRAADIILPSTSWLEEIGVKATEGHIHLCETILPAPGDARPVYEVIRDLADRLGVEDFYPWTGHENVIDAVLAHPATGHATVAAMRGEGGRRALDISHHAYPDRRFGTPSGKIEFRSDLAASMGLPALPVSPDPAPEAGPLRLAQGRAWTHFHSFYDQGRAIPALAEREPGPELWISPDDAAARGITAGDAVRLSNLRGAFEAKAKVTRQAPVGTVWLHDGWAGFNQLMDPSDVLPVAALDHFPFSVGQADYSAEVEVERA